MTRDVCESNFSLFRNGVIGIAGPIAGQPLHHRFVAFYVRLLSWGLFLLPLANCRLSSSLRGRTWIIRYPCAETRGRQKQDQRE
jgi:hypothetical protein